MRRNDLVNDLSSFLTCTKHHDQREHGYTQPIKSESWPCSLNETQIQSVKLQSENLTSEATSLSETYIATPRIPEEFEGRSTGSKLRNIEKPGSASCDLEIRILGALGRISEIKIKSGSLRTRKLKLSQVHCQQ